MTVDELSVQLNRFKEIGYGSNEVVLHTGYQDTEVLAVSRVETIFPDSGINATGSLVQCIVISPERVS